MVFMAPMPDEQRFRKLGVVVLREKEIPRNQVFPCLAGWLLFNSESATETRAGLISLDLFLLFMIKFQIQILLGQTFGCHVILAFCHIPRMAKINSDYSLWVKRKTEKYLVGINSSTVCQWLAKLKIQILLSILLTKNFL